jgi:hypothetical protein
MQEHFHLADGVSEAEASSVFNNVAWKVIKDAFKHACCISIATYYTWVLKQQMKPMQPQGVYLINDHPHASLWCGWTRPQDPEVGTILVISSLKFCVTKLFIMLNFVL